MMQFKPYLIVNRLIISRGGYAVYDEFFHNGVNIIRGKNSSGKSTIADFIFYSLGGELSKWKKEASLCDFTYIEVNLSGKVFSLRREIRESSKTGMDIFNGPLNEAMQGPTAAWLRYPYSATENKESFYQAILKELGIPYSKSDASTSITLHQLLRLMYVDQMTSLDRLFKFDRFDNANKRKAIGELLIGLSDLNLYQLRLQLQRLDAKLETITNEIKTLHKYFGSDIKTATDIDAEIERSRIEIVKLEASLEAETDPSEQESEVVRNLRADISRLNTSSRELTTKKITTSLELNDSERFITSLLARLQAIEDSSRAINALSNIGYKYCPSCFEPVKKSYDHHCSLCGSEPREGSSISDPTFKIRKEIEFQIAESNIMLSLRQKDLSTYEADLENIKNQLSTAKSSLDFLERPIKKVSQKTREALIEIGQLNRAIQQLGFSKSKFSTLYDLYNERDTTQQELNLLRDKVGRFESELERSMSSKKSTISKLTMSILRSDLDHEEAFVDATYVDFDFGEDKVSIDDRVLFSASSMVFLKNAFRLALLQASCNDPTYLYPRFLLMDNVEDKGMEPERSHIFQQEIIRVSNEINIPHQIIFTTSMIDQNLDNSDYCVGDFYNDKHKTLNFSAPKSLI